MIKTMSITYMFLNIDVHLHVLKYLHVFPTSIVLDLKILFV